MSDEASTDRLFRVAWTADFFDDDGQPRFVDLGADALSGHPRLRAETLREHRQELAPDQLAGIQGVIVLSARVSAASLENSHDLLAIGRFGVGYDTVDVPACTAADVAAFITAGAVDRSVAEATLAWMLALTHKIRDKDALVRAGKWSERSAYMGSELRDRALGVVGLGGIGRALVELTRGFGMLTPLAFDPLLSAERAAELGVRSVGLDELMSTADFVSIHCPLNDHTRDLIGARELSLMKPNAYLLNTARGGIVNEAALFDVLQGGRIAGAGIDCFTNEPLTAPPTFSELDNVLLAPHSIAWTNELFRDIGRMVCQGMVDLSCGKRPKGLLNPEVFDRPGFQGKLARHAGRASG